jgi:hypothetical protein
MPIKPHPTDPDKMVYVNRYYDIPQLQGVTMTPEDEEFNRIERESKQRMESVRLAVKPFSFYDGLQVGRSNAFKEIAEKIKAMPFGGDTIDSLIMWLEEQK